MRSAGPGVERIQTLVIGGGQAGLSTGYHLSRLGVPFLIVDAAERIGDAWRGRWDSLRLFTPARFDGLDGMPMPNQRHDFPTKDEMAAYLEAYADRFDLPVLSGTRVEHLGREGKRFLVTTPGRRFVADNVVVAMSNYQKPHKPPLADRLDPAIVQIHSAEYRNPSQLVDGPVLIVGAGNSGAEIAKEVAASHPVLMSGRDTGQIPFRINGLAARLFLVRIVLRGVFHRVLTVRTPMGRKMRVKVLREGGPLIRVKSAELSALGVERVPRVADVRDGLPVLENGRVLEPANVIWCTGFTPGFEWIDLPVFDTGVDSEPDHRSGIVESCPGLYFVGLHFQYAYSSVMIHGVGRDAARVASHIAGRASRSGKDVREADVTSVRGEPIGA